MGKEIQSGKSPSTLVFCQLSRTVSNVHTSIEVEGVVYQIEVKAIILEQS